MTEVQFAKQFLTTLDSKNTKYQADHTFDPKTFQTRVPYTLPKLSHPPHPLPPKTQQQTSSTAPAPGSEPSTQSQTDSTPITLTLRSARNPTFTLHLPSLPSKTTIATLKSHVQSLFQDPSSEPQIPIEKIKILYNKKPIPPTKPFVHDVLVDSGDLTTTTKTSTSMTTKPIEVEFSVMIMGGAPDPTPTIRTIETSTPQETEKASSTTIPSEENITQSSTTTSPQPVQPGVPSGKEILTTKEFWDDLQGFLEQRLKNEKEAVELRDLFEKAVVMKGS